MVIRVTRAFRFAYSTGAHPSYHHIRSAFPLPDALAAVNKSGWSGRSADFARILNTFNHPIAPETTPLVVIMISVDVGTLESYNQLCSASSLLTRALLAHASPSASPFPVSIGCVSLRLTHVATSIKKSLMVHTHSSKDSLTPIPPPVPPPPSDDPAVSFADAVTSLAESSILSLLRSTYHLDNPSGAPSDGSTTFASVLLSAPVPPPPPIIVVVGCPESRRVREAVDVLRARADVLTASPSRGRHASRPFTVIDATTERRAVAAAAVVTSAVRAHTAGVSTAVPSPPLPGDGAFWPATGPVTWHATSEAMDRAALDVGVVDVANISRSLVAAAVDDARAAAGGVGRLVSFPWVRVASMIAPPAAASLDASPVVANHDATTGAVGGASTHTDPSETGRSNVDGRPLLTTSRPARAPTAALAAAEGSTACPVGAPSATTASSPATTLASATTAAATSATAAPARMPARASLRGLEALLQRAPVMRGVGGDGNAPGRAAGRAPKAAMSGASPRQPAPAGALAASPVVSARDAPQTTPGPMRNQSQAGPSLAGHSTPGDSRAPLTSTPGSSSLASPPSPHRSLARLAPAAVSAVVAAECATWALAHAAVAAGVGAQLTVRRPTVSGPHTRFARAPRAPTMSDVGALVAAAVAALCAAVDAAGVAIAVKATGGSPCGAMPAPPAPLPLSESTDRDGVIHAVLPGGAAVMPRPLVDHITARCGADAVTAACVAVIVWGAAGVAPPNARAAALLLDAVVAALAEEQRTHALALQAKAVALRDAHARDQSAAVIVLSHAGGVCIGATRLAALAAAAAATHGAAVGAAVASAADTVAVVWGAACAAADAVNASFADTHTGSGGGIGHGGDGAAGADGAGARGGRAAVALPAVHDAAARHISSGAAAAAAAYVSTALRLGSAYCALLAAHGSAHARVGRYAPEATSAGDAATPWHVLEQCHRLSVTAQLIAAGHDDGMARARHTVLRHGAALAGGGGGAGGYEVRDGGWSDGRIGRTAPHPPAPLGGAFDAAILNSIIFSPFTALCPSVGAVSDTFAVPSAASAREAGTATVLTPVPDEADPVTAVAAILALLLSAAARRPSLAVRTAVALAEGGHCDAAVRALDAAAAAATALLGAPTSSQRSRPSPRPTGRAMAAGHMGGGGDNDVVGASAHREFGRLASYISDLSRATIHLPSVACRVRSAAAAAAAERYIVTLWDALRDGVHALCDAATAPTIANRAAAETTHNQQQHHQQTSASDVWTVAASTAAALDAAVAAIAVAFPRGAAQAAAGRAVGDLLGTTAPIPTLVPPAAAAAMTAAVRRLVSAAAATAAPAADALAASLASAVASASVGGALGTARGCAADTGARDVVGGVPASMRRAALVAAATAVRHTYAGALALALPASRALYALTTRGPRTVATTDDECSRDDGTAASGAAVRGRQAPSPSSFLSSAAAAAIVAASHVDANVADSDDDGAAAAAGEAANPSPTTTPWRATVATPAARDGRLPRQAAAAARQPTVRAGASRRPAGETSAGRAPWMVAARGGPLDSGSVPESPAAEGAGVTQSSPPGAADGEDGSAVVGGVASAAPRGAAPQSPTSLRAPPEQQHQQPDIVSRATPLRHDAAAAAAVAAVWASVARCVEVIRGCDTLQAQVEHVPPLHGGVVAGAPGTHPADADGPAGGHAAAPTALITTEARQRAAAAAYIGLCETPASPPTPAGNTSRTPKPAPLPPLPSLPAAPPAAASTSESAAPHRDSWRHHGALRTHMAAAIEGVQTSAACDPQAAQGALLHHAAWPAPCPSSASAAPESTTDWRHGLSMADHVAATRVAAVALTIPFGCVGDRGPLECHGAFVAARAARSAVRMAAAFARPSGGHGRGSEQSGPVDDAASGPVLIRRPAWGEVGCAPSSVRVTSAGGTADAVDEECNLGVRLRGIRGLYLTADRAGGDPGDTDGADVVCGVISHTVPLHSLHLEAVPYRAI